MDDEELIRLAEAYSKEYHKNQKRKSGELYYKHPFRVRDLLMRYGYDDAVTQCIALLHDVFEETAIIRKEIKTRFGYEIANGVFILSRNTITPRQRDIILKLMGVTFENITKDMTPRELVEKLYKARLTFARGTILRVKIADTIDNTWDLENLSPSGRNRKITDAKEFYIPLGKKIAPEMIQELEKNVKKFEENS